MAYDFYKWGDMDIHVQRDSYVPPTPEINLTEIKILADATGNPASVLQEGGRGRKRSSFSGYAITEEDYQSLMSDYLTKTPRLFKDTMNNTFTAIIESFSPTRVSDYYTYDISLVEV